MIVTLKDIADRVGVHPSTVSRVLRNKEAEIQTSSKKREQIIQLAKELNYQPNQIARSFRLRTSQTIGYIVPDISNIFYAYFAKRLEQEGEKSDLSLIICNTGGDLIKEKKYINKLYAKGIDGIIIAPAAQSMNSILSLKKLEIPFVLINPQDRNNDFELFNINSYHFVYNRIKELLKSHIHKIAFLGTSVNSESFNAFVDAHRIMKIKINDDLIFMGKATFKNGYFFAEQLLRQRELFNNIVITNEILAMGVKAFLEDTKNRKNFHFIVLCDKNSNSQNYLFINDNNFDVDQYAKELFAKLVKKMNQTKKGTLSANSTISSVAV
jgi:LacI family transcriptional regulator